MTGIFKYRLQRGGVTAWTILAAVALLVVAVMAMSTTTIQAQDDAPTPTPTLAPPTMAPTITRHIVLKEGYGVTVVWTYIEDPSVTNYELWHRPSGGSEWLKVAPLGSSVFAFAHYHNRLPQGAYEFRVRALNAAGAGPWSDIYTVTPNVARSNTPTPEGSQQPTPKKRLTAVRNLTVTPGESTTATVTWTRPVVKQNRCQPASPPQYRYKVVLWTGQEGDRTDREEVVDHTTTSARTVEITSLTPGTKYGVLVWSYSTECNQWSKFRREIWTQPGG